MGSPLSPLVKHQILSKRQSGQSLHSISKEAGVSYAAAWSLWDRFQKEGQSALKPRYENNGRKGPGRDCLFFRAACWLKRRHPDWGAPVVHTILKRRYGDGGLASIRQLNRWFEKAGLSSRGTKMPENCKQWAREVHDTWQMDAKEQVRMDCGLEVCWLSIVDERSGGLIAAPPFPPRADFTGWPQGVARGADQCVYEMWTSQNDEI